MIRSFAAVFGGGAVGGVVRVLIDAALHPTLAWDIVAINVVGSFLLGALAGRAVHRGAGLAYLALGPGLLGGFTTFSALAAFEWSGASAAAHAGLLVGTMLAAALAAAAGWRIGASAPVAAEQAIREKRP